jgi:hypothetical protein
MTTQLVQDQKTLDFIQKAQRIHGDKYDYSKSEFVKIDEEIEIICLKHGAFKQKPLNHLEGHSGCKKCHYDKISQKRRLTQQQFVDKANKTHNFKYDYSKFIYVNNHTKGIIICPIHGEFLQTWCDHLASQGCPKCKADAISKALRSNTEEFIEKAKTIHGDLYDYSLVDYKTVHTKVKIICTKHGVFEQTPGHHNSGQGCPICKSSGGELSVKRFLDFKDINYIREKTFEGCKNVFPLKFDFWLPDYNLCIEYQGKQHYLSNCFYGEDGFKKQQIRDQIKRDFCKSNNIDLLEIPYTEDVNSVLEKFI